MNVDKRDLKIEHLTAELEKANDKIDLLEEEMGKTYKAWPVLKLTSTEQIIMGMLMRREFCRRSTFHAALYSDKFYNMDPTDNVIPVFISHLRKKLEPWGIVITTQWGQGWYLTREMKEKVKTLNPQQEVQTQQLERTYDAQSTARDPSPSCPTGQ